ncbi:energy coupling factor transporter S component ThiW [Staphylococcus hyicus]|uniref:Energy coupling factor transporter S component ThiW n=2 Tax=Staphylococcus hyicus TaxID=1284 RepID=A0ACD5FLQ0_STAHY|nr:energy coupling factor transporter S component ThiW [Staphylococcus hyicus]AJC96319.1 thiamine biosynthesis protein ThiW [Staphylococcus hyicus]MCE5153120.1 energy coupling factor transporter S component ThiW [Staphylococcus hyicus]MCO4328314.1 energy coupling factor transporter S component ThiW [Staphylococcus hyicus]MCO4330727.1 energy coupling factor transporter S component ThiW [Staphylococcus hyicus]MCO4334231.1 energy coupling factor transporter S component ThiW [Staphylococcus hyicus
MNHKKLTLTALFIAVNVILSTIVVIPIGPFKAMPVQHFINVLSAVLLGPWFGLAQAFLSSLIRLLFGLGTPFAFPGSMVGVLVASLFYYVNKHLFVASIGEVIGTGIIGSLLCIPLAWILGLEDMLIKPLMATFLLSSFVGASLSYFLLIVLKKRHQLPNLEQKSKRKF